VSFRDDHDAALMRADAAERERKIVEAENQRLEAELASAREWLGGPSKRAFLLGGLVVLGIALVVVGVVIGRATASPPAPRARAKLAPPPPSIAGVIVADGWQVGHWTLMPTRCTPRGDGIELTNIGNAGRSIWLTNDQVELELPSGTMFLTKKQCFAKLVGSLTRTADDMFEGHVELDCTFETNRLQGRIDFKHCR
jgi:hypothetical protein